MALLYKRIALETLGLNCRFSYNVFSEKKRVVKSGTNEKEESNMYIQ